METKRKADRPSYAVKCPFNSKIGSETACCMIDIDNENFRTDEKSIDIGSVCYMKQKSRYHPEDNCECARKYVHISEKEGKAYVIELYAECFTEDVPELKNDAGAVENFLHKALDEAENILLTKIFQP